MVRRSRSHERPPGTRRSSSDSDRRNGHRGADYLNGKAKSTAPVVVAAPSSRSPPSLLRYVDVVASGGDLDPFGNDAPYWRRHYGIGRPWSPSSAGRRGCLLMLYAVFAAMVVALVVAGVVAVLS